jgi:hypothetical protein
MRDFYTTAAQVLPVLMLAFLWESGFLIRIQSQPRPRRRVDQLSGVVFWTKSRVRYFLILVAATTSTGTAVSLLVLGGFLPDAPVLRLTVAAFVLLALGTLLTRVVVDIVNSTAVSTSPIMDERPESRS